MIQDYKISSFPKTHSNLADDPSDTMTAAQLKAWWDDAPEQLRVALSGLIDNLSSVAASNSGAENIGSAPITGVTGSTVYAQIADVKNQINQYALGQLPDGSVITSKLADSSVTAAKITNGAVTEAKLSFDPYEIKASYNVYKSGTKDANGFYPIVDYKRTDGTLYMKSTLSNPNANGYYQTDTWQYYATNGTTLVKTITWTIAYDAQNVITSKVFV